MALKKEKKEVGKEKRSDYNERLVSQKKQQQRKLKDTKEGNLKLKHFSTANTGKLYEKKLENTYDISNVNFLV